MCYLQCVQANRRQFDLFIIFATAANPYVVHGKHENDICPELNELSENVNLIHEGPLVDMVDLVKVRLVVYGVQHVQDVELGQGVLDIKVLLI